MTIVLIIDNSNIRIVKTMTRDLWLLKPSPVIAHRMAYQQKLSSEQGISLPNNAGQNGHEMPPKVCGLYDHKGARSNGPDQEHCQRRNDKGTCHLPVRRLNPRLLQLLTFNSPRGSSGWGEALCAQGVWRGRSVDSWMLLGTDYGLDPCISFCLEKHQMPSWWHQILVTNRKPLVKGGLHGAELPFPQSLTQCPSPTAALEQSLRAVSDAASRAAVLILPQIKLNSRKEKKTMTTHQLTFFSSSLNLVTDTEGATLCLPDIKLLRQKMQPHCPRPAPPDKSAELHHLMSRMKQVCRWDKQWKIPACGTGSLFLY